MNKRTWVGALAVVSTITMVAPAWADPTPEEIAAARTIGTEGLKLADAGDCVAAIGRLERAATLVPAPTILTKLGECQIKVGRLVAGTENLRRSALAPLAPGASQAFVKAQESARQLLAANEGRIGKVKVVIRPADAHATVTVDGEPVAKAILETERPTDPGNRTIEATAPGFKPWKRSVEVRESTTTTVEIGLQPEEARAAPPVVTTPPTAAPTFTEPPPPPPTPASPSRVPAYVAFGIGGAGLVVGTIFGLSASAKKSSLDGTCVDKHCPTSSQSDVDAMKSSATVSTLGFAVGVVGLGVGTVLFLRPGSSTSEATSLRAQPYVGLGSVGLRGAF